LPELLGRNFAIAFFLPISAFLAANYFLLTSSEMVNQGSLASLAKQEPWLTTTMVVFLNWLGGVFLLASNRLLLRTKEGYGLLQNPKSPFLRYQKWRWERLKSSVEKVDQEIDTHEQLGRETPSDLIRREIRLHRKLAEDFPDRDEFVLPTAFGNTIRAFETYPRRMYGISAVRGWSRLIAVIPSEFMERLESSKTQVDFLVNLWCLSIVFALECLCVAMSTGSPVPVWIAGVSVLIAFLFSRRARSAAAGWGELVCGSFDVYLPELKTKLGFDQIHGRDERDIWQSFSRAIIYRNPAPLPKPAARVQFSGVQREGDSSVKIDPDHWYTTAEAAGLLKLSPSTLAKYARAGSLREARQDKRGSRWFIKGSSVAELADLPGDDDERPPNEGRRRVHSS
jgi:hypothetical protein